MTKPSRLDRAKHTVEQPILHLGLHMLFRRRRLSATNRDQRSFGIEQLSDRLVLSANPLAQTDGPAGEGELHTVDQQGSVVVVSGSDLDDMVRLVMGLDEHSLTINGEDYQYDASEVDEIMISGMSGRDEVNVQGSSLDDRIEILTDTLVMINARYNVRVDTAETVRVVGAGGDDTAKIFDSSGNDQLYMHTTYSAFVNQAGDIFKVSGVEQVEAFADKGGRDIVRFYDSPADDRFVAKTGFAYMIGDDFWNFAKGFERVDAYQQNGGLDNARFYDSSGDDHLVARPDQVIFTAGGTVMVAHDFYTTRTIASDGNDTAELHGQQYIEDRFVWQEDSSYMFTTGKDDPTVISSDLPAGYKNVTASNLVVGFDRVEGLGGGPQDRAELRGSAGNDRVIALPEMVQLTTPNAEVEATDFRIVRSHGRGGTDRAQLQDSPQNDNYVSNDRFAYLEGPDYLNYVAGFAIDVFALEAGDDYAHAKDYVGPGRDYLIFDDNQFLVWGPDREERIHGFSRARSDGAGPAGFQLLEQISHPFILGGSHDQNDVPLTEVSTSIVERSDEAITIYVILDGDIVAQP